MSGDVLRLYAAEIEPEAASTLADRRASALSAALGQLGWECVQADVDLRAMKARLCLQHHSGRIVTLDADGSGRASVTREQQEWRTEHTGRRGDRFLADRLGVAFLGRSRYPGIRSAMRGLADYLADNAGVDRQLARAPLAGLLAGAREGT